MKAKATMLYKSPVVPEATAAYAAALHRAIKASWLDVAMMLERAGLGEHDLRDLARAALAWEREHVTASAKREIERLRR